MNSKNTKIFFRIFLFTVLIVLILLLLKKCSIGPDSVDDLSTKSFTEKQSILLELKRDEEALKKLYDSSDICSVRWIADYRDMGVRFQTYGYFTDDDELNLLLKDYIAYGKKIEEIAIFIDDSNLKEAVAQLEDLKDTAENIETRLEKLYEEEFAK